MALSKVPDLGVEHDGWFIGVDHKPYAQLFINSKTAELWLTEIAPPGRKLYQVEFSKITELKSNAASE